MLKRLPEVRGDDMSSRLVQRGRVSVPKALSLGKYLESWNRRPQRQWRRSQRKQVRKEYFPEVADERTERTSSPSSISTSPTNSLVPLGHLPRARRSAQHLALASFCSWGSWGLPRVSWWPKMALQVNCKHWVSSTLGFCLSSLCSILASTGERTYDGTPRAAEMVN